MKKLSEQELSVFLNEEIKEILNKFNITIVILQRQQDILFVEIKENNQVVVDDGINIRKIPQEYTHFYIRCRIQEMLSKFFQKKWKLNG